VCGAGVDVSAVVTDAEASTGVYFKDPRPERTVVYYYRAGSAASRLDASALDHPGLVGVSVLHVSGITPALSASCRDLIERALFERPLAGAEVSFDVNYRPSLWTEDAGPVLQKLADAADTVFVGLDEAHNLWGVSEPAAIRRLLPGPRTVVIKDGSVGATAVTRDGASVFEPAVRVRVVEHVGAGDAFAAGYLSASLHGRDLPDRLRMGHLVASHALTVTADHTPLPESAWFDERIAATSEDWSRLEFAVPQSVGG
jgi:2-dehydro-3-deoxygluconokinase